MLAETVAQWPMQWRNEGIEKGRELRDIELVQKMLGKGKTPKDIIELTDIPLQEVLRIAHTNETKPGPLKVSETSQPYSKIKPRKKKS